MTLWGTEGRGTLLLTLAMAFVFAMGLALQLFAVRTLDDAQYSTFVLSLGIATVATMVASAIQPVVALQMLRGDSGFLPIAAPGLFGGLALVLVVTTLLLEQQLGLWLALLTTSQVPLHLAIGVASGVLQGRTSFAALAFGMVLWSGTRLCAAVALDRFGVDAELSLVAGLAIALGVHLAWLVARNGFAGLTLQAGGEARHTLRNYVAWLSAGWVIYGDAAMARVLLPGTDGARYALALTLGRQAIYASSPMVTTLVPAAALAQSPPRHRLAAILGVSALLTTGLAVGMGLDPALTATLVAGTAERADPALFRGYVVVGGLGTLSMLLLAWATASDRLPVWPLASVAAALPLVSLVLVDTSSALLVIQFFALTALAIILLVSNLAKSMVPISHRVDDAKEESG